MSDTYRALCAELTEKLQEHTCLYEGHESELIARARAALAAQPEPGDGEIDEEAATVIPWLLEEAAHAADADQSYVAGKLTLAAQLLGERRPAIEPVPGVEGADA